MAKTIAVIAPSFSLRKGHWNIGNDGYDFWLLDPRCNKSFRVGNKLACCWWRTILVASGIPSDRITACTYWGDELPPLHLVMAELTASRHSGDWASWTAPPRLTRDHRTGQSYGPHRLCRTPSTRTHSLTRRDTAPPDCCIGSMRECQTAKAFNARTLTGRGWRYSWD